MAGNRKQKQVPDPKSRSGRREGESEEDKMARSLQCFLNQPNINMVIPWVYAIYRSVTEGGGGGGGGGGSDMEWEDLTQ